MIDAGSARGRAFARLNRSLRRAARRQGAPVRTITETSNDSVRYPELIPTLLDWYENLDAKVALPAPRDRAQMLSALARSLITPDAPTEEAFRISAIHLESAEPGSAVHLHGVMLLLSTTASPSDPEHRAVMSRLGAIAASARGAPRSSNGSWRGRCPDVTPSCSRSPSASSRTPPSPRTSCAVSGASRSTRSPSASMRP